MGQLKLPPSVVRILSMSVPILMEHYALVKLKTSKLSSTQRKRVEARFDKMIERKPELQEEVNERIKQLKELYNE